LFDKNVTIYGRSNMCQFEHEDKKIKLLLSWSKVGQPKLAPILLKKTKGINLISVKALDQEPKKGAPFMILTKEITEKPSTLIPSEVPQWLWSLLMSFLKTSWTSYHWCMISNTPLI